MLEGRCLLIIVLAIIFSLILISPASYSQVPIEYSLIYEGELPAEIKLANKKIKTFKLLSDRQEYIIVNLDSEFKIYRFTGEDWESVYKIDINTDDLDIDFWEVGDLDNDMKDELILFNNKRIVVFDLIEHEFIRTSYDFPYYVDDALVGDIDNNNLNELLLFCCDEPKSYDRFGCKYELCIVKFDNYMINIFWSDKRSLRFGDSGIVPPDRFICIADIENTGHNQLLVTGGQSDLSPTYYNILFWDNECLERSKSFRITRGAIRTSVGIKQKPKPKRERYKKNREEKTEHEEIYPFLLGDVKPALIDGKTLLLADMINNRGAKVPVIVEMNGDNIKINNLNYIKHYRWYPSNIIMWANIDGKAIGIMQISYSIDSGLAKFRFYR